MLLFPAGCVRTPVYHRPDVDKDGRQLHVTEHTTRKRVAGYVHIVPVVNPSLTARFRLRVEPVTLLCVVFGGTSSFLSGIRPF